MVEDLSGRQVNLSPRGYLTIIGGIVAILAGLRALLQPATEGIYHLGGYVYRMESQLHEQSDSIKTLVDNSQKNEALGRKHSDQLDSNAQALHQLADSVAEAARLDAEQQKAMQEKMRDLESRVQRIENNDMPGPFPHHPFRR